MQVTETQNVGLKRQYHIVVPAAKIAQAMDAQLVQLGQNMKVPGFRPGKVPMQVVRQRHAKTVFADVVDKEVDRTAKQVMKERDLRLAVPPQVTMKQAEEGKDLAYDLILEIYPTVPELALDGLSVVKPVVKVGDAEVQEGLERLAKRTVERTPAGAAHKAKDGDVTVIDFTGHKDGKPFPGGSSKKFTLELGSGQFIPGFEEQLIGAKVGQELKVNVTFPEDYHSTELAGQPVTFDVVVHEIQVAAPQALDDAFATKLGFETLDALKDKLREFAGAEYAQLSRNHAKKSLFDQLAQAYDFEVPEGMVNLEFQQIWQQLQEAKNQGDPSLQKSDEELTVEYRAIAERRVRLGLLLAELGRVHHIEVSREKLNQALMEQARQFPGQEQKVFDFFRKNPAQVESIRGSLLEEEVVDFILGKIAVTEKEVTKEELSAFGEDDAPAEKPKAKKSAKAKTEEPAAEKPAAKGKKKAE